MLEGLRERERQRLSLTAIILDPSTHPLGIRVAQDLSQRAIWPLFKVSRALICTVHKQRLIAQGKEQHI